MSKALPPWLWRMKVTASPGACWWILIQRPTGSSSNRGLVGGTGSGGRRPNGIAAHPASTKLNKAAGQRRAIA
jgi:hypothetical protein